MMALFLAVLLAVSIIDVEHRIVPNRIVYPSTVVSRSRRSSRSISPTTGSTSSTG